MGPPGKFYFPGGWGGVVLNLSLGRGVPPGP